MTLHLPNRFVWFAIALVIFFLLQSGCQPIQPTAPPLPNPTTTTDELAGWSSYNIVAESVSLDRQWTATTLFQEPSNQEPNDSRMYYQGLVVTHSSGTPSYTLVNGWLPWGLGYTLPVAVYWSQDGEHLYYTNRPHPDGCGLFANGSDLYQVDLATGETVELLPPNTTWVLGLAPSEKRIAYRTTGEFTLTIQDLTSGVNAVYDIATLLNQKQNEWQDQLGALVWSPDSSTIAFAIAHKPCAGGWAESISIYTLDADTLTLVAHLEQDDRLLIPVAWPSDTTLLVENQVPFDRLDQKRQFTFDLATNAVTPVEEQ